MRMSPAEFRRDFFDTCKKIVELAHKMNKFLVIVY